MINLNVNRKFKDFLLKPKMLKVAYGGRSGSKTTAFGDMLSLKMHQEKVDIYCLREFQDSVKDSVHRVFKSSIENRLGLTGWDIQKTQCISPTGNTTRYVGAARNPQSVKGAEDYLYSWFEEAQTASQESLDLLIPTIIRKPGAECWFSFNPGSSEDPVSKQFIIPFEDELLTTGKYEDDMHLIVVVNWRDNPWWTPEMEKLRLHHFNTMSRSRYDWIWEGAFNDSVENSLILAEWFDACIDAHKKLGFEPVGALMASHDPADEGNDTKGYAMRHGSVILDVDEMTTGNVNEGGHWATGKAISQGVDHYTWDCDGMGIALREQTSKDFNGKHTVIEMFKGSEGVDFPENIFEPVEHAPILKPVKIKNAIKNKRAQYYFELRKRVYNTFLAVTTGQYIDPDNMISIDSSVKMLSKLKSELCRMPVKPNTGGKFELYTKEEMKAKFKFNSPNLADSVMMLMRQPFKISQNIGVMPQPIKPIGRR